MVASPVPLPLHSLPPDQLLSDVLAVSMTGIIYYTPLYDSAGTGEIVDFRFEYLNPAAQRMMRMPEVPTVTHNQQWPHSREHGTFAFHVDAFVTGEPREYNINYQADGYDNYYRLAARRSGPGLLVSFTDTADQPRSPVEVALRESQAAEQAARAEVERHRRQLQQVFHQAPVAIAVLDGPDYRITLANPSVCQIWARPEAQLLGVPLLEALPELQGQGVDEMLDRVLGSGEPFIGSELPFQVQRHNHLDTIYFNFVYQPQQNEHGLTTGVLVVATDVTGQVLARQQVQQLNQELEARVAERTQAALALQADLLAATQRQVQERETFYQVFAQTPASIALLRGPAHRFEYVNAAYQQLFPGRNLIGHPLADVLPDAAEQGFLALLDGVYRTGETFLGIELPLAIEQPDGRPPRQAYFNFTYQAYYEHGQIAGISIFAYDVAEQVLVRQQREAERQQLHDLFMEAPAPIVILDGPDLVFQLANPAYQRIFPGRDLLGRPVLEALSELRGTPLERSMREVYETGFSFVAQEMPLHLARLAGGPLEERYFTFTFQARRNAQGAIDGLLMFGHEVTDLVQARRVVEGRETSFRQLADNVPGTLWVTNPRGECTYLSARWYATTGQTLAEGLGLGWTTAIHPEDAEQAGVAFLEASAHRQPYNYLFRLRQRDGHYRWITDNGLPRFGPTGEFEGMVGSVVDVHEQKLAELALQRLTAELRTSRDQAQDLAANLAVANEQLMRTNVDLDNFIYTASHDLKAPISNIEGLLLTLRDELPPPHPGGEVDFILDLMQDSVNRFTRTIEHLTDVSRLQKEHNQPQESVPLAAVIEDVRLDLAPLLQQTGGRLEVAVGAVPHIQFSVKNLRSVVYNLLSNALKYHHPERPPVVRVRGRVESNYQVLEVQDNGLGLDLTGQQPLFGMFQRFHSHVEGTGIGLYMVKRMVENAGGHIEVMSTLGEGTTFSVYFPHA